MNDYEKMSLLYEGYIGQSMHDNPNGKYPPVQAPGNISYPSISPFNNPGGEGSAYNQGLGTQGLTTPISDDEEENAHPIISKISELMQQAHNDEMPYAVHTLGVLKEFVKANL